jgi:hypothetical protein
VRPPLVLGAVLLLAACKPSSDHYTQSVTVDLPPAVDVESINVAGEAEAGPGFEQPFSPPVAAVRTAPAPREPSVEPKVSMAALETAEPVPAAGEAAPDAAPAETAPAASRPPLPDATIARTLGGIGFSCGRVVATSPVEDGAWRIDCSSGASYRASDRTGRMRFKRW